MLQLFGRRNVRIWLAIVGCSTLVLGAAYTIAQQSTRLAANDLPLATVQTAKHQLSDGSAPEDVIPTSKTNLASDSTVFLIVTDDQYNVLASSASLGRLNPAPPNGVFATAKAKGIDKVTWQPAPNVRAAIVVEPYKDAQGSGFLVAGQSLAQPEDRTSDFLELALAAWLAVVALATLLLLTPEPWNMNRRGGAKTLKKTKV